jgi:hypothetical protein
MDRFAEKVPTFNFKGKGNFGSWPGLIVTVAFWFVLIFLTSFKVIRLVNGTNPLISSAVELDFYGSEDKINIA